MSGAARLKQSLRTVLPEGFIVGGAVRDALLGRACKDIDLICADKSVEKHARALARALNGTAFVLDPDTGVYRVTCRGLDGFQLDLSPFQGSNFREDIFRRDFTVNALAVPVSAAAFSAAKGGFRLSFKSSALIDLTGGARDLKRGVLKAVKLKCFDDDPLRLLRAFRLSAELGFSIDMATRRAIKTRAGKIKNSAGERVQEELLRFFACGGAADNIRLMDDCGLLTALFPELDAQRKCAEVYYGKGGVLKHTRAVVRRMEFLLENLGRIFPKYRKKISAALPTPAMMKLTALLHDVAKPATAKKIDGRLRFFLHEDKGADMSEKILRRLKFSLASIRLVKQLISGHLRPGNLASNGEITDRAVYRFFRDYGEHAVPLLLLCWADYASYITLAQIEETMQESRKPPFALGKKGLSQNGVKKTLRHLQLINHMFRLYFDFAPRISPPKLLTGHEIMKSLNIPPSRTIGRIMELIEIEQVEGRVKNRAQAEKFIASLDLKSLTDN